MTLSLGVVGCGVIGRKHLDHLAGYDPVRLRAVADLSVELRSEAAAAYSPETSYASGEALIDDPEVEAVVLALPAEPRYELTVRALRAGKHVFLEKPVARSVGEVDSYLELARPDQIVGCASARFRFLPSYAALRRAIDESGLRPIRQIIHEGTKPNPALPATPPPAWRLSVRQNGGGIMSNWGCYDLDWLLSLLEADDQPTEVTASWRGVPLAIQAWVADGSDAETHVTAMIRFASGTTIVLNRGEYLPVPEPRNATTVLSDDASVSCSIIAADEPFTLTRYDEAGTRTSAFWSEPDDFELLHRGAGRDFVDACIEGRQPATGLQRARLIQSITDAIYRSAREQRSIRL